MYATHRRPKVESTAEDLPVDLTTAVVDKDDDDANVDAKLLLVLLQSLHLSAPCLREYLRRSRLSIS